MSATSTVVLSTSIVFLRYNGYITFELLKTYIYTFGRKDLFTMALV